jgi:diadenosine tetraphosphate (Ap4A) HIT family hydrolase
LSVVLNGPIIAFCHLEPHRHIPDVAALDGPEAATFGPVLARAVLALKSATGADLVYTYIFGERVPHFHVNLAPHLAGDGQLGGPGMVAAGTPDKPADVLRSAASRVRDALASDV